MMARAQRAGRKRGVRAREKRATVSQHTQRKGWKKKGHSCLAFARAGLGYLYDKSGILRDNVHYTAKGGSGGKGERKVEVGSCRRQTARRRMRKEESGNQKTSENEWYVGSAGSKRAAWIDVRWQETASKRGGESKTKDR